MMSIRTDPEIREAVVQGLTGDSRIDASDIAVDVDQHVVTLRGRARTWTAKLRAQEVAHRVQGVLDVANDLEVAHHAPHFHDSEIARAVRLQLEHDPELPDTRIATTVSDGIVTLLGTVDSNHQRERAEQAVRSLDEVYTVVNQIEVVDAGIDSRVLHAMITDALERHAAREASRVSIEVDGNRVALRGTVGSWAERSTITGILRGMRGIEVIDDHLRVIL